MPYSPEQPACRILYSVLAIVLLFAACPVAPSQDYTYEIHSIPFKGELVNFQGRCILQDSEGFIWFGSEEGLYRYNASGFTIFRYDPDDRTSISNNRVQELYEDRSGTIWAGTYSGLNRLDKTTGKFKRYTAKSADPTTIENDRIDQIEEDENGCLWLATYVGFSRFDTQTESFRNYSIPREEPSPNRKNYRIFNLKLDAEGRIWLDAENNLYRMDTTSGVIEKHAGDWTAPRLRQPSDRQWFMRWGLNTPQMQEELDRYEANSTRDPANRIVGAYFRALHIDRYGNHWIRTSEGIFAYNRDMEMIYSRRHSQVYAPTADYDFSYALLEDNTGTIWFYTPDAINQLIRKKRNFMVYDPDPVEQNYINCVCVENRDHVWLGTLRGILSLDRRRNTFTQYYGKAWDDPEHRYSVRNLYRDSRGTLWAGLDYEGLIRMEIYNGVVKELKRFPADGYDRIGTGELSLYAIKHLFEDSKGRLWIGLATGPPGYYDREDDRFITLVDNPAAEESLPLKAQIRHETGSGILWATGRDGVFKYIPPFTRISENEVMPSGVIKCRGVNARDEKVRIPPAETSCLDSTGVLWLATPRHGLIKLEGPAIFDQTGATLNMSVFTTREGLPSNDINSIVEDAKGNLWLGTQEGLSRFNLETETFTNYYMRHGLPTNELREESVYRNEDGELFFGSREGLITFYPDSLQVNQYKAPVKLTDLRINNRPVSPGEGSPLERNITYTDTIELRFHQNSLSFEFAILNYLDTEMNQYKYRLEGLEEDWIYAGNRTRADYTNLRPGRYTFRVEGANNDGVWNEQEAALKIRIHPPPWQTWYAYLVYGFILVGIILWYRRYLLNRARLRTAVEVERIEKEKIREMDRMRSRFFANVSHEFRTPLTLIRGPLDELAKKKSGAITLSRETMNIIRRNTHRLQRLINQLLDISKMETGNISLSVSEGDLGEFVRTLALSFLSLAESKQITYEYEIPGSSAKVYFDRDKLEKILANLISNAFKFTPSGGKVKVGLQYNPTGDETDEGSVGSGPPDFAEITVSDTGKGIPAEKIDKIFDRFYQASDSDTREEEGTGIGLALTRELVDLYRGKITVESEVDKGSTFRVSLPVSREHFREEEIKEPVTPEVIAKEVTIGTEDIQIEEIMIGTEGTAGAGTDGSTEARGAGKPDAPLILIVEDNEDLRNYIAGSLGDHHRIRMAENGKQGLESAVEEIPDLVISDVMMPEMDGMEMCRKLKEDERTCHIPVIILTAKADRGSKMEGLETGADDYLIKPFDTDELRIRVRNLVEQRKRLREKFRKEFESDTGESEPGPQDQLIKKLMDILELHIDESEYNINQLTDELHMSRSQVYRKVTAITGYAPNELIRNFRLKKAAGLFRRGHRHVAQVMHRVGFNNQSYFSKCFSELYGMPPSAYIDSKQN